MDLACLFVNSSERSQTFKFRKGPVSVLSLTLDCVTGQRNRVGT